MTKDQNTLNAERTAIRPHRSLMEWVARKVPVSRLQRRIIPSLALLADAVAILVGLLLGAKLRTSLPVLDNADDVTELVSLVGPLILVGWLLALFFFGNYSTKLMGAGTDEYRNCVNASVVSAGLAGVLLYLAKVPLSRAYFIIVFAIGIPLLLLGRFVLRRLLHRWRQSGLFRQRVLVAGDQTHIDEITAVLHRETWLGYRVIGALYPSKLIPKGETTKLGIPYVGPAEEAAHLADAAQADVLIIASRAFGNSLDLRRTQWALEHMHVQVVVAPAITDISRERVSVRPVAGLPLVHLDRPQGLEASRWAKRFFDLSIGTLALIGVSPLMLVGYLAVKLHDRGPVLFRQARVGRDGEKFMMLKFRSMVVDAEAQLVHLRDLNESDDEGVLFKMSDDPRITKPGRWMRRYSIDELPQLFNVLKGDMSLVGPRPALPHEVEKYDEHVMRRLRVRPGITGLWQVSGRSDLSWEETVRLDLYYVDNWSLLRDLTIMSRTLSAVLRSDGAY